MCADRVQEGLDPACAQVCPTHAIEFGDRDEMVAEAERRVAQNPGTYVPHIYGKDEVGGTNVLHLSSVPFEKLGYEMGLPTEALPNLTHKSMRFVPTIFLTLLGFFSFCAWVVRRRMKRLGISEDH
jgi:formate dehydrogenase iron-sulfur subunit